MNCPKCGSVNICQSNFLNMASCNDCDCEFTIWQQQHMCELEAEVERIRREFTSAVCELAAAEARVQSLEADLQFLGASHAVGGNLTIDMPKYHKAHCEKCETLQAAEAALKEIEEHEHQYKESWLSNVSTGLTYHDGVIHGHRFAAAIARKYREGKGK